MSVRDVLIVGAGPSGLATAIAAKQQGLDHVLVEKGMLVNSIFNFPTYMVFFTTPELLEVGAYRSSRRTTNPRGSKRSGTTGVWSIRTGCRSRFTKHILHVVSFTGCGGVRSDRPDAIKRCAE